MKTIDLRRWPEYLADWASPGAGIMEGAPTKARLLVFGRIGKGEWFEFAESRDALGTGIHLRPPLDHPIITAGVKAADLAAVTPTRKRKWLQEWAKVASRAGYLKPDIDPAAYVNLVDARRRHERLEFIVDTNILTSGVGHWLVGWFGDLADFVRTVVTDLELANWNDGIKWSPEDLSDLQKRTQYLAACRFLEFMLDPRPIWRRVDTAEETSLFVPKVSANQNNKTSGTDALLLRAARRLILDQVPKLRRYFVTGDRGLARAALHDLPVRSVIAAYVNPIADGGAHLTSTQWWPDGTDHGKCQMACLAHFVYEASCICDEIEVRDDAGRSVYFSAFQPDVNQFPSQWENPFVWVHEKEAASTLPAKQKGASPNKEEAGKAPGAKASSDPARKAGEHLPAPLGAAGTVGDIQAEWPLKQIQLLPPFDCAARVSMPFLLEALGSVMTSVRDNKSLSRQLLEDGSSTAKETRTFLRAVGILGEKDGIGSQAATLVDIFAHNDTDALTQIFVRAENFQSAWKALSAGSIRVEDAPSTRSTPSILTLARALGIAVLDLRSLAFGGAFVDHNKFVEWLGNAIDKRQGDSPLGEVPIASLATAALSELHLSPMRFAKALEALRAKGELAAFEFGTGGTPTEFLMEEVIVLNGDVAVLKQFGADNILGLRSVKRKTQ